MSDAITTSRNNTLPFQPVEPYTGVSAPAEREHDLAAEFSSILDKIASRIGQATKSSNSNRLEAWIQPSAESAIASLKNPSRTVKAPESEGSTRQSEVLIPGEERSLQAMNDSSSESTADKREGSEPATLESAPVKDAPTAAPPQINNIASSTEPVALGAAHSSAQDKSLAGEESAVSDPSDAAGLASNVPTAASAESSVGAVHEELASSATSHAGTTNQSLGAARQEGATFEGSPVSEPDIAEASPAPAINNANEGMVEALRSKSDEGASRLEGGAKSAAGASAGGVFMSALASTGLVQNGAVAESAPQTTAQLLRQALDVVRSVTGGGLETPRQVSAAAAYGENTFARNAAPRPDDGATARSATRPQIARAMERVDAALKEVAHSKDGKTISVRLDPQHLGEVKVDVSLRDGTLHARIAAESTDVAHALRERAHELVALLRRAGIDADKVTVTVRDGGDQNSELPQFSSNGSFTQSGENKREEAHERQESHLVAGGFENLLSPGASPAPQITAPTVAPIDHWVA